MSDKEEKKIPSKVTIDEGKMVEYIRKLLEAAPDDEVQEDKPKV